MKRIVGLLLVGMAALMLGGCAHVADGSYGPVSCSYQRIQNPPFPDPNRQWEWPWCQR